MPVVAGIMCRPRKLILPFAASFSLSSLSIPRTWINLLRRHFQARWTVQPNRFHGSALRPPPSVCVCARFLLLLLTKTVWLRFETIR